MDASTSTSMPPDVFISYVQADRAWADWISDVLRDAGRSTATGGDLVPSGDPIESSLTEAITSARELVVLLSDRATQSPWVRAEIALAKAAGKPIIAVVVDDAAALPAELAGAAVVRLTDTSLTAARERLLDAFERRHPSGRILEARGTPSEDPPEPVAVFANRRHEMTVLEHAFLETDPNTPATVVLTGSPGMGKTALATMFVSRHRDKFDAIRWIRSSDALSAQRERLLPVPGDGRTLLVIDDVDNYEAVADLLAATGSAHVLLISRARRWGRPFQVIELGPLDHAAAVELVTRILPDAPPEDRKRIAHVASGSPVLLRIAAEITRTRSPAAFLEDFETFKTALATATRERQGYYFLDTDDPRAISEFERALEEVLDADEHGVDLHDRRRSSWRGWWRRRYSPDRVDALADRAERAAEVAALIKPEGEANRSNAEAVARLIEATSTIPNLVVISGSVLLIKVTDAGGPKIVSKTLTATELRRFQEREELLSDPARALAFLQTEGPSSKLPPPG